MTNYRKVAASGLAVMLISSLTIFNPGCAGSVSPSKATQEMIPAPDEQPAEPEASLSPVEQVSSEVTHGFEDLGDLEPGVRTITANHEPSEPIYTASLYLPAPPSPEDEIKVLKWFVELQIDSLTQGSYIDARVRLNDHELNTVTGYPFYQVHNRGKATIYGYLYAGEENSGNIFMEGENNTYDIYLWTSSGTAAISQVRAYNTWRQDVWVTRQIFNHQSATEADLLDATRIITATAEPVNPDFSWQTCACATIAPDIFKVRQTVIGFSTIIDSLGDSETELHYRLTFNGYSVAEGSFTTVGDHRDAATMVPEEVETRWSGQGEPNIIQLYLWLDRGEAAISDLQMYYGVGNSMNTQDSLADCCVIEAHISGITSWVFYVKHRGEGTPEFRLAPTTWPYTPTFVQEGIAKGDTVFSTDELVVGSDRGLYLRSKSSGERDANMIEVVALDILTLQ